MSEELLQQSPSRLGRFLYYKLGASTLGQLKDANVFSCRVPDSHIRRKPDGLVISGGMIKAFVEYKEDQRIRTEKQVKGIIDEWVDVANHFCKILIISSGSRSIWVNAKTGNHILLSDGSEILDVFDVRAILDQSLPPETERRIERLISDIDSAWQKTPILVD